jgi:hypothetical protein
MQIIMIFQLPWKPTQDAHGRYSPKLLGTWTLAKRAVADGRTAQAQRIRARLVKGAPDGRSLSPQ